MRATRDNRAVFTRVGSDIQYDLAAPDPADAGQGRDEPMAGRAALDGFNPPQQEFKALKAKLAELRKIFSPVVSWPSPRQSLRNRTSISLKGKLLKWGMKMSLALRKRLDVAGDKGIRFTTTRFAMR